MRIWGNAHWGILLTVGMAAGLGLTGLAWALLREEPNRRVYRIGIEESPPLQTLLPNGEPRGYAVETIAEAARRRGIRLQWMPRTDGPDHALRSGAVDLWPLMTVTEDRRLYVHFTDPYEISEYVLLVRDNSPLRQASDVGRGVVVSHTDAGIFRIIMRQHYAAATPLEVESPLAVLSTVCSSQSQAALVELRETFAITLADSPCRGIRLRALPDQGLQFSVAMASTLAAAQVADSLRSEVNRLAGDGTLIRLMSQRQHSPGGDLFLIHSLQEAKIRDLEYQAGCVIVGLLFVAATIFAVRYRRKSTQLRVAERELREKERELRLVADSLNEMVLAFDMQKRVIYANAALQRIVGFCMEEPDEAHFLARVHEADRERVADHWQRVFRGESFFDDEYRLIDKDGGEQWILASWGPLLDENGAQIGVRGSQRDITMQKRMEETLRQSQREREALSEQLQQAQKLESIGRLAGGIAHDFNNLLTVINGYCSLILETAPLPDSTRDQIEQVRHAGQRAAALTQQLLAFSRKQIIKPELLNLNATVAASKRLLRRLVGEDIEFVMRLAQRLGTVRADPGQIGQVLFNLVVNARDAMPHGGKLTIETADAELDGNFAATHRETQPGSYVMLAVCDTGCGMDGAMQQMIFEPFFTTKPKDKGTGLGLATVYGIVKQNGGSIAVSSEIGVGTTFRIYLPRIDGAPEPEVSVPPSAGVIEGTETILVVEDQQEVRRFVVDVLRAAGYRVLEASNGAEALQQAERFMGAIRMLLTDVIMPGMNGRELAGRLVSTRPDLKVVYTSGYTGDSPLRSGIQNARAAFLPKPFSPEALTACVRKVLSMQ